MANAEQPVQHESSVLTIKSFGCRCSKMLRVSASQLRGSRSAGASEILRSEAYLIYAATTKDEENEVDGRFSAPCEHVKQE